MQSVGLTLMPTAHNEESNQNSPAKPCPPICPGTCCVGSVDGSIGSKIDVGPSAWKKRRFTRRYRNSTELWHRNSRSGCIMFRPSIIHWPAERISELFFPFRSHTLRDASSGVIRAGLVTSHFIHYLGIPTMKRRANQPAAGKSGTARLLAVKHHCPGRPEPDRLSEKSPFPTAHLLRQNESPSQ